MTREPSLITGRSVLLDTLWRHNPFYLLSAVCMLGGCLALTNSLSWTSIPIGRLLALIATLNLYEFALIGLALFLVVRRGIERDGRTLLVLQALFLADITFLNAEIATLRFALGVTINVVLYALAMAKLLLVIRVLRPAFSPARFAFVMIELLALFAVPCVFRASDQGAITPMDFYGAWWLLALLPALFELTAWIERRGRRDDHPAAEVRSAAPTLLYVALPWVALLAHLGILHYVYDVRFYAAHSAPVFLGLTLIVNRLSARYPLHATDLRLLRLLLPLAAILVSMKSPAGKALVPGHELALLNTVHFAVAGAYLVYVYCFFRRHAIPLLIAGVAVASAKLFGPTPAQVHDAADATWDGFCRGIRAIIPSTATAWGIVSVTASFVFLAVGAAVSLLLKPATPTTETTEPGTRM